MGITSLSELRDLSGKKIKALYESGENGRTHLMDATPLTLGQGTEWICFLAGPWH